jgi:23S rRNA (adenine2503-C2)-methyltransferase
MKIIRQLDSIDGSVKFLLELSDKNTIEALYMRDKNERLTYKSTLCVSSQVGCQMGCLFCATGRQGLVRNLSDFEIVDQVKVCEGSVGSAPIKAIVFAGMGEPLLNYENVKSAIFKLKLDLGISDFELATVGVVPSINKLINDFADKNIFIRLNLSLHGSTDEMRNRLIPYNKYYNIDAILEAAARYGQALGSKVRIRYMLIKGLNDSDSDIERLCRLLSSKPFKLILSTYNDNGIKGLSSADQDDVARFYDKIKDKIDSDIFFNFGKDIQGGCGQLRQLQS